MGWGYSSYGDYAPYVSVAERKAKGVRHAAKLAKQAGRQPAPIEIKGRQITSSFWGNAWADNLTAYSDYSNRLPRGRTYVCNGSVVDLVVTEGRVNAIVAGSKPYTVKITIEQVPQKDWGEIKRQCAGQIGSLVELLQGKLSKSVMEIVTRKGSGLFPKPKEIRMSCSCPDAAGMCKHLAAVMYGIGARLDQQPELLFLLRKVDHLELITSVDATTLGDTASKSSSKKIASSDLSDMFGIEFAESAPAEPQDSPTKPRRKRTANPVPIKATSAGDRTTTARKSKSGLSQSRNVSEVTAAKSRKRTTPAATNSLPATSQAARKNTVKSAAGKPAPAARTAKSTARKTRTRKTTTIADS